MKKLSIITICYNEPNLEKTCESIVNQTWQEFEWIVIDGGSNIETQKIWDKYKYRIDKFISDADNGIFDAFNKGIKLATCNYINFLNAGDFYADINALKNIISSKLNKDLVYGDLNLLSNNEISFKKYPDVVTEDYLKVESLPCPSMFIKRNLFEKYGNFDTTYKIVSDWEKWIVFICINKCSYKHIPVVCSVFDMSGISSTNPELNQKERNIVIEKYFKNKINQINYTFWEKIFSLKNNTNHKVITILGLHINIRRRNK